MTLERTESPIQIPDEKQAQPQVACDYIDVTRSEADQPHFRLQPHSDGGKPIGPVLVMDREGAAGLVQHLAKLLEEGDGSAADETR